MHDAIAQFLQAHDRYQALCALRPACRTPAEREQVHLELLQAYVEVQRQARIIAGLQAVEGIRFAEA